MVTAVQQDLSPRCRGTNVNHLWGSQLGPLRTLLGFTLPCVYASDSSSTQSLPQHINNPVFPDTGDGRIKDLFDRAEGPLYREELINIVKSGVAAAIIGMVYGGLPGARHARERFIQLSQAEIYNSRVEAVRAAHNAAIRGFMRFGWRWSWRLAAFVTLFNTVETGLTVYRDRNSLSHFAVSGAITGGVFRMTLGLKGLLAGSAIGVVLGLPAGVLILGLQTFGGETMRDKRQRERRELNELKVAEWSARLKVTDDLIEEMNSEKHQDPNKDLQKIEELRRNLGMGTKGPHNQN